MIKLSAFLALMIALLLSACGEDDPAMRGGSTEASTGLSLDRAFAAEMIPHHESAVEMAVIAQERGESPFVRRLAETIISTQTAEIEFLRRAEQRLAKQGVETGSLGMMDHEMGMGGDVQSLSSADPFDKAFMEMMIEHHEGAVAMAKIEVADGSDPDLQALAEDIIVAQEQEISEMRDQLGSQDSAMKGHG